MSISIPSNTLSMQLSPMTAVQKAIAKQAAANPGFVGITNLPDSPSTTTTAPAKTSDSASLNTKTKTPEQEFMDMMGKNPAQAMQDRWLEAHGITKEKLAAMTPEEYKKVMDQMKQDIENKIKEALNKKQIKKTNFSITA